MELYNQNKEMKKIDFNGLECIGFGNTSNIYKIDDKIFKAYYDYTKEQYKLDLEVFKILNQINSKNMIKIYELLYAEKELDEVVAYTAEYYEDQKINIFNKDIEYVLNNIKNIENLFDELACNMVRVSDVKNKNTILTDDRIILIDPDAYKKVNYSVINLKILNKKELLRLFKNIYAWCMRRNGIYKNIHDLFDIEIDTSTSVTDTLSKKLIKIYKM